MTGWHSNSECLAFQRGKRAGNGVLPAQRFLDLAANTGGVGYRRSKVDFIANSFVHSGPPNPIMVLARPLDVVTGIILVQQTDIPNLKKIQKSHFQLPNVEKLGKMWTPPSSQPVFFPHSSIPPDVHPFCPPFPTLSSHFTSPSLFSVAIFDFVMIFEFCSEIAYTQKVLCFE